MPRSSTFAARLLTRVRAAFSAGIVVLAAVAAADDPGLVEALAGLVEEAIHAPQAPPAALLGVHAPRLGLDWHGAAGAPGHDPSMQPAADGALRIASNTKTYVAAAVLRLVEDGRLDLDAPVERVLLPASLATLRSGGYEPAGITVRMLLQHTSGLFDYAGSEAFLERLMQDPQHRWTRAEQLEWAMSAGSPYGAPGEVFHYSDTGYILLGEVLETMTEQPMPAAIRSLLRFEQLGIRATWFERLEPDPCDGPPRVQQFSDGVNGDVIDASADLFGGGGLVSTLPDMARFYRALLRGGVFRQHATLVTMLEPSPQSLASGEGGYGMGLGRLRLTNGIDCFGHGGFWGTEAWHCPTLDLTVVGAVTESAALEALRHMTQRAIELTAGELTSQE